MKNKMKYLVALIVAATTMVIFLPVLHIGDISISTFDLFKIRFATSDGQTFESIMKGLINSTSSEILYLFAELVFAFVGFILFNAAVICLLHSWDAYGYAIASSIVLNISLLIGYMKVSDIINQVEDVIGYLGQGEYIYIAKAPIIIWIFCYSAIAALSVFGMISLKNERVSARNNNVHYNDNPIPFFGGIKCNDSMFCGKIFMMEELMPVYLVKNNNRTSLMKYDSVVESMKYEKIDEIFAEIYYVPQYEEYVVRAAESLKVFLASGQPLGKEKLYYLPRNTKVYCENEDSMFVMA